MKTTALAKLAALTLLTLSSASLVACGGDTTDATTARAGMALKKRADGKPTGNGVACSWVGVSGAVPGGAPDAPIASPPPVGAPDEPTASPPHAGGGTEPGASPSSPGEGAEPGVSPPNPGDDTDYPGTVVSEPPGGYVVGAPVPSPDGCNTCTCTEEGIACTVMACAEPPPPVPAPVPPPGETCELDGVAYPAGQSFTLDCNTCSCTEQGIVCTARACADEPHARAE